MITAQCKVCSSNFISTETVPPHTHTHAHSKSHRASHPAGLGHLVLVHPRGPALRLLHSQTRSIGAWAQGAPRVPRGEQGRLPSSLQGRSLVRAPRGLGGHTLQLFASCAPERSPCFSACPGQRGEGLGRSRAQGSLSLTPALWRMQTSGGFLIEIGESSALTGRVGSVFSLHVSLRCAFHSQRDGRVTRRRKIDRDISVGGIA